MLEFKHVKSKYWQTFILAFLTALLLFLPISLRDAMLGQPFHYAGDYNSQSMLFWQYANQFIKDGGSFSWETELGSGFVNSYSYYMLGSPFFWASLWIPSKWMPWAMVPLFCFKFAVAGAGGYLWTKRWVKNPQYAMLAGMLYAFCGYNIYSIFYDSFVDVTALFPYLLAALDDAIIDKRRGCFSIWVAVSLLINYYFFIGEAIFLILYFICMLLGKKYILTGKLFLRMAVETVLGIAMGAVLVIPAALSLMQNPRISSFLNDYDFIVYGEPQKYMAIFASMFIMPDAPYQNTLFSQSGTQWQNVCAYLPVVGITGGVALCRAERKHPFARVMKFCIICAFVPMLNAIFTLENATYYARWYYMPILILCGATAMVLDNDELYQAEWKDAWKTVFICTAAFVALELVPSNVELLGLKLGVTSSASIFWILWGISIAGVVLCGFVCKKYRKTEKYISVMMSSVMVFSFIYVVVAVVGRGITGKGGFLHIPALVCIAGRDVIVVLIAEIPGRIGQVIGIVGPGAVQSLALGDGAELVLVYPICILPVAGCQRGNLPGSCLGAAIHRRKGAGNSKSALTQRNNRAGGALYYIIFTEVQVGEGQPAVLNFGTGYEIIFFQNGQIIADPLPAVVTNRSVPEGIAIVIYDFGIIHYAGHTIGVCNILGGVQVVHCAVQHGIAVSRIASNITLCIQINLGDTDFAQRAVILHDTVRSRGGVAVLIGSLAAGIGGIAPGGILGGVIDPVSLCTKQRRRRCSRWMSPPAHPRRRFGVLRQLRCF